jgi:hypothetical protein
VVVTVVIGLLVDVLLSVIKSPRLVVDDVVLSVFVVVVVIVDDVVLLPLLVVPQPTRTDEITTVKTAKITNNFFITLILLFLYYD